MNYFLILGVLEKKCYWAINFNDSITLGEIFHDVAFLNKIDWKNLEKNVGRRKFQIEKKNVFLLKNIKGLGKKK